MNKKPEGLRTWIEIDRKAVASNYRIFRDIIGKNKKFLAVVKSNAYGHGLFDFSKEMELLGADWLGVDSATEALALRSGGIRLPILVLGYTLPEMISKLAFSDVSFTVSSLEQLETILHDKSGLKKKIHIKADTGMGRQGFLESDIGKVTKKIKGAISAGILDLEGLFTHFSSAKNPAFPKITEDQLGVFDKWISAFKEEGWRPLIHAAATGGAILYPKSHFDMVRIGIGLYGLWPSKETEFFAKGKIFIKPVLEWKSILSELKEMPAGSRVGYDCTETLVRRTRLAVCPVGYWHGYPRALSSIGKVLVRGEEARVLGRISMDMIVIDVTDINFAKTGDIVTLIGKDGHGEISAEYLSSAIDISPYEFITRLNPLMKRIYQ